VSIKRRRKRPGGRERRGERERGERKARGSRVSGGVERKEKKSFG
jgi:hypothetical protein